MFGLNAARVYGLRPDALRGRLSKDRVHKRKADYLNDPRPSFATYGPRTREDSSSCADCRGATLNGEDVVAPA